jgi:hypothetical protein
MEQANDVQRRITASGCRLRQALKKKNVLALRVKTCKLQKLPEFIQDEK